VLLNEAGRSSRAWPDVHAPENRFASMRGTDQGAVCSPDGMLIQFDSGTIWQRSIPMPAEPPPPLRRYRRYG
jgi:hypothetical protein